MGRHKSRLNNCEKLTPLPLVSKNPKFFALKVRMSALSENPYSFVRPGQTPSLLTANVFYGRIRWQFDHSWDDLCTAFKFNFQKFSSVL